MTPLLLGAILLLGGILFFILFFKLLRSIVKAVVTAVILVLVLFVVLEFAGISSQQILFPNQTTNETNQTNQSIIANITTAVTDKMLLTGNVVLEKITDKVTDTLIDSGKEKIHDMVTNEVS